MLQSLQHMFGEAEHLFEKNDNATPELRAAVLNCWKEEATNLLGRLAFEAPDASRNDAVRDKFQRTAQKLIDFLETAGHGNLHKMDQAIEGIAAYYPSLRIPIKFQRPPR